jgi:HlyD family secretion protein
VLQIPASALFRFNDQWALFAVLNDKAKRRTVRVGRRNGLSAQILDGLTEGQAVITHPDDRIEDGVGIQRR